MDMRKRNAEPDQDVDISPNGDIILTIVAQRLKISCKCGWVKNRGEKYGRLLTEYMPVKLLNTPFADIVTNLEQVYTKDMDRACCAEIRSFKSSWHEPLPYKVKIGWNQILPL